MTEVVFDRTEALARVGGDLELLGEIAGLFLNEYPRQVSTLAQAVESGDSACVEKTAHSLKGSAATFGARSAVESALALERAGRARDLSSAPRLLANLQSSLAALRAELLRL